MSQERILQYLYMLHLEGDTTFYSTKELHVRAHCECDLRNTMRGVSRLFDAKLIEMDGVTFLEDLVKLRRPVRKYRLSVAHIEQVERVIREFNLSLQTAVAGETIPPNVPPYTNN